MERFDYIQLRSSVSVVKISENIIEFFLSDIRTQVRIRVFSDDILNIILTLDGTRTFKEIISDLALENVAQIETLFDYLMKKHVLTIANTANKLDHYFEYRRTIHFLENYAASPDELKIMWNNIRCAHVVIVGLGAVGSWVAVNLVQSGVNRLTLIDNDVVDISNIHRQIAYMEDDVGKYKVDVIEKYLQNMNEQVVVCKIKHPLDEHLLENCLRGSEDLVINCADKPTVDQTSLWVGKYCMNHKIPHIIGGGYNMHLSLVGQTVIPYETACVKCYEKQLEEVNAIDIDNIKKMETKNRKIGSLGPLCALNASLVGIDAIKVLSKHIPPVNVNRRGEFDIYSMKFTYTDFQKDTECEWCGTDEK